MLFTIITLLFMASTPALAVTSVETYSSATANTGGNSGSGSIQTGNASASSSVESKINSEDGTGSVKVEAEAEANGEKVEKKTIFPSSDEEGIKGEVEKNKVNDNEAGEDDNVIQDDNINQEGMVKEENDNPQPSFMGSIITRVKDFFSKITSIFS